MQLHRATRSAIKGVCLATPDPLSKTCASRSIAARRSAIKGVCLATPGPRSRTIALAVRLCFAVLVLRFNDTRFPLPLLTQIATLFDVRFTNRALARARSRIVASRALVYEHRFQGFSILPSTSSHAHTSELRSSLGPEHILATSAGLVKVKLCVDSFMIIHMCSSL